MSIVKKTAWLWIVALAWSSAALADRTVSESRSASSDVQVSIEVLAGDVKVVAWNENRVSVEGTLGDDVESLEVHGEGDDVEIVVEVPDGDWGRRKMHVDANLEIRVPRGASVEVETLSADISVTGITGRTDAESVSGDVTIDTRSGRVEAGAVSGDVTVRAPGAERVDVESVSGDVEIEGISGSVSAEAVSGDIKVDADLLPGAHIEINSMSGSVELAVPASASARFRVETFSGRIDSDFGSAVSTDEHATKLDTTLGSGDARVEIECFSGRVRIRSR